MERTDSWGEIANTYLTGRFRMETISLAPKRVLPAVIPTSSNRSHLPESTSFCMVEGLLGGQQLVLILALALLSCVWAALHDHHRLLAAEGSFEDRLTPVREPLIGGLLELLLLVEVLDVANSLYGNGPFP